MKPAKNNVRSLIICSIRPPMIWGKGDNNILPAVIEAINKGQCNSLMEVSTTGSVNEAGARVAKYVIIGEDGPTGKFFSEEMNPETGEIPW